MLLPAWQLPLLAGCWPSPDAAEGESSSTRTSLGVHGTDTAPASSPVPRQPGGSSRGQCRSVGLLLTWSLHPGGVGLAELCYLGSCSSAGAVCPCSDSSSAP